MRKTVPYQQGLKKRCKIESNFDEGKQGHGLGHCRYISRAVFAIQTLLTVMALNLKRMVQLLAGISFKKQSTSAA